MSTTFYCDEERLARLAQLRERTGVSVAELIRRGVDLALAQHGAHADDARSGVDQ